MNNKCFDPHTNWWYPNHQWVNCVCARCGVAQPGTPVGAIRMTGTDLRAARLALGLSQTGLARGLGVTVTTVSNWERDVHPLPPFLMLALRGLALRGLAQKRKEIAP